jgi:hypothetical protein
MPVLSTRDLVWNRACFGDNASSMPGDRALAALLAFHGPAMNGGVLHAAECLTDAHVIAAADGYRYFGFPSVAALVRRARLVVRNGEVTSELEREFNEQYWQQIPNDGALVKAFEADYAAQSENYEPVQ